MKKKKQQLDLNKRRLELEEQTVEEQLNTLSKSWRKFVTIIQLLQIALLLYFVIATLMTSSQEQPFSLTLWIFMGIALAFTGYAIFQLYTLKTTNPFLRPAKRPIGTKFDHFLDQFAKGITYLSYAIAAWATFMPQPYYKWAIWVALIYPLLLVLIIKCSGNRFTLNKKYNGAWDLSYPMMASLVPAFGRGIMDFSLEQYAQTWYLAVGISLGLVFLFIKSIQTAETGENKDDTDRYISFVTIWITFLLYSIGIVRITNCYFDTSLQEQQAYVVSKSTSKSKKNRSYWVEISIGKEGKTENQSVGINTYENAKPGNAVKVYYYNGALLAPWHEVYF